MRDFLTDLQLSQLTVLGKVNLVHKVEWTVDKYSGKGRPIIQTVPFIHHLIHFSKAHTYEGFIAIL